MHVIIFEFEPAQGRHNDYFEHVAALKTELESAPGFISVERFESLTQPGKLLSLSFWESEDAIAAWRAVPRHRKAQTAGRAGILSDYRIRVAEIARDYTMGERNQAPADSVTAHG